MHRRLGERVHEADASAGAGIDADVRQGGGERRLDGGGQGDAAAVEAGAAVAGGVERVRAHGGAGRKRRRVVVSGGVSRHEARVGPDRHAGHFGGQLEAVLAKQSQELQVVALERLLLARRESTQRHAALDDAAAAVRSRCGHAVGRSDLGEIIVVGIVSAQAKSAAWSQVEAE